MKIATHPSVQVSATSGVVIAAGLYLTDGNPIAWAIAGVWAVLAVVAVAQAARS